jgi:hypothetical protein
MPTSEFLEQLPAWAVPFVIFAVMAYVFVSRFSEASESIAKMVPVLGKYWQKKGLKREQDKEEQIMELVETVVNRLPPRHDYEVLSQEMDRIRVRLQYMESMELINQAYLIEDAKWHAHVDIQSREHPCSQCELRPFRLSYTEFVRKWRDENWRPVTERPI